ncbi:phytanoyl-CoA dioxygenase family protein [Noviherbaspirillum sp. ST9]|uniref:phytanoyl-CoA dioxygenase family protein n=1 Tax=Noviherbaspirillum sp. ST9 TaxID=3401606 RepID=UPI003B585D3C
MSALELATQSYEAQGFAVLRQWLAPEVIVALAQEVDRIHAQWMHENRSRYEEERLVNMHSLTAGRYFRGETERIRFFDLVVSDGVTALVDGMFGAGIYFHNTQLFFNPWQNRRSPYWHRDMQYSPVDDIAQANEQARMLCLHVRIPLVPEQGIEVIPGTHRRWDTAEERDVRLERHGRKNSEDLPDGILIALEPGDVMVFDAQMIHRGNYARNPERRALDLCVGRPHPFTLRYLDESVLPTEGELANIRNKAWFERARELVASS